jgi:5-methylthioadenosine/S-adenosylhomocysteine deaminase
MANSDSAPADVDLLLFDAEYLCVVDADMRVIRGGALAITDGVITHVGPSADVVAQVRPRHRQNMSGRLVMPGLINLHTHLSMTLLRGVAEGVNLQGFLQKVWAEEARVMDPHGVYIGARLGAIEALLGGTTTTVDMYFHPEAAHRGAVEVGLRHVIGPVFFSFPGPDNLSWNERMALLHRWPDIVAEIGGPQIPLALMPHAPLTVNPTHLAELAEYARTFGSLVHTHASENTVENDDTVAAFGRRPIELLEDTGILALRPILAHAVRVNDAERGRMAELGASVAHCPGSNLKLASGALDWAAKRQAGILTGLGTDGCSSSNDLDMFSVMRLASNLARLTTHDPMAAPSVDIVRAATVDGARALGMADHIGSLAVGTQADVIAIDLDAPHLVPLHDPYVALVYAAGRSDIRDVWVAGEQVIADRTPVKVDQPQVIAAARTHVGERFPD